jgi:hypothetical protein
VNFSRASTFFSSNKGGIGMINISLEENQVQMLIDIHEKTVADLGYEISNTDMHDYRQQLKERRIEVSRILEILQASL